MAYGRIDISRHRNIDQEHRFVLARRDRPVHFFPAEDVMRRAARCDHDIHVRHGLHEILVFDDSALEFFRHGMSAEHLADPTKVPMYILVLTQAWESLVNMLLWPVTWLTYGLYYYDLRVRQEGLDVLQNLRLLEQRSAS